MTSREPPEQLMDRIRIDPPPVTPPFAWGFFAVLIAGMFVPWYVVDLGPWGRHWLLGWVAWAMLPRSELWWPMAAFLAAHVAAAVAAGVVATAVARKRSR